MIGNKLHCQAQHNESETSEELHYLTLNPMKVPLRQVLTTRVLHHRRAHELINRLDFRMTKCILRRTD